MKDPEMKKTVEIYTDGACSGNPGPGGWGAILRYGGHEKELSGGEAMTTNNRMELSGVIAALEALKIAARLRRDADREEGYADLRERNRRRSANETPERTEKEELSPSLHGK